MFSISVFYEWNLYLELEHCTSCFIPLTVKQSTQSGYLLASVKSIYFLVIRNKNDQDCSFLGCHLKWYVYAFTMKHTGYYASVESYWTILCLWQCNSQNFRTDLWMMEGITLFSSLTLVVEAPSMTVQAPANLGQIKTIFQFQS